MVMVKSAAKGRGFALPASWEPNDDHARIAEEERRDLAKEVHLFRDNAAANGRTRKDWDAAFRNWLRGPYGHRLPEQQRRTRHLPAAGDLELPPDGLTDEEYDAWENRQRAKRAGR